MSRGTAPVDGNGNPIQRAMGIPQVQDAKYLSSATKYIDMLTLPNDRVYHGISVYNPSSSARIHVAIGPEFGTSKCMVVLPQTFSTFDNQTFGAFHDKDGGFEASTRVRAKLDTLIGVLASGTLTFSGQPSDGQNVVINGFTYEFTNDGSANGGGNAVAIGAALANTLANLVSVINQTDQAVTASKSGSILTITSNAGGTDGNALAISAGTTSATASGANLTGGSGGVLPVIHIW